MMKKTTNKPRVNFGAIVFAAGVLMFAVNLIVRLTTPGTFADTLLFEGMGILLAGLGIVPFLRGILNRGNPAAARRKDLEENDERALSVRYHAGYTAFLFAEIAAGISLIGYSALTRGVEGFDPIWYLLIFLAVAPMLVYTGATLWYNRS